MYIAPDVAREVGQRFMVPLENLRATHSVGRDLVGTGHGAATAGNAQVRLALFFLARATLALNAVDLLFSSGLDNEAVVALRTIVELAIDFDWLWKSDTDDRVKLFAEYIHVVNVRRLETQKRPLGDPDTATMQAAFGSIEAHAPTGVTNPQEMNDWIRARYAEVAKNYPKKHQWCQKGIRERATEVDLEWLNDLVYRRGSEMSHSNAAALASLSAVAGTSISVRCDPTSPRDAFSIVFATLAFQHIATRASERMGLGERPDLDKLHAETMQYVAGR